MVERRAQDIVLDLTILASIAQDSSEGYKPHG
jgi:hypothetical protein